MAWVADGRTTDNGYRGFERIWSAERSDGFLAKDCMEMTFSGDSFDGLRYWLSYVYMRCGSASVMHQI